MANNLIEKYGIQDGDRYVATSGSGTVLQVIDSKTHAWCDDVIVADVINDVVMKDSRRRIDAFKLHMVRYTKVEAND